MYKFDLEQALQDAQKALKDVAFKQAVLFREIEGMRPNAPLGYDARVLQVVRHDFHRYVVGMYLVVSGEAWLLRVNLIDTERNLGHENLPRLVLATQDGEQRHSQEVEWLNERDAYVFPLGNDPMTLVGSQLQFAA